MKAGVITLHSVYNYGTQLQAFATQEKLKQYFNEVTFIDYKRKDTYGIGLLRTFSKGNPIKALIALPTIIYWKYIFGSFQEKHLHLSTKEYLSEEDFKEFEDFADIYFTGSDQVWNTGWNKGIIKPFYLHFVPEEKKRYAFASSFGITEVDDSDIQNSKKYIDKYEKITVREESAISILKEQYSYRSVSRILDPTLIMPASFWRAIEGKRKVKEEYILIYNLQRSYEFDKFAQEISKRTGIKLYRLCTRFDQIFRTGKSIVIPPIFEFVSLIDHAKFVITDSFHATAFSMNMETQPICVYPTNYASRLSDFLLLVESQQCHIKDFKDYDVINRQINFNHVKSILEKERTKVDIFLSEIVETRK